MTLPLGSSYPRIVKSDRDREHPWRVLKDGYIVQFCKTMGEAQAIADRLTPKTTPVQHPPLTFKRRREINGG